LVGNVNGATEALSTIIADDETFFPALIERAKMYLIQMKYALAKDSAQQSFVIGRGHIEALRVLTLILFLTNDNGAQRLEHLEQLSSKLNGEALPKIERKLEVTKLFSRLCGNDKAVLEITTQLVSEACDIELDNWESRMEFARQLRRLGRYDEALCQYQFASNLDQGNTDTLEGMILCQVLSGALEEAKQQIEFLELVQDEESVNEEMLFVQLLINDGAKTTDVVRLTRNLVLHFSGIIQNTSFEYSSFDLGMVFDVAMHFISTYQFCKESLMDDAEDAHVELSNEVCDLLHHVTKRYPSDGTALALVAKVKYEMKDFSAAETMFQPNVNTCAPNALLTVIEAQIKLSKNNISASRQSLEQALSQEFAIQRDPLYRLVKGSLHANEVRPFFV
jgi:tetratricopeptide (TPR) repeat protein